MGHPDFRVHGRIFATLSGEAQGRGVLKLTLEQQRSIVAERPDVLHAVQVGWGRMGMTYVELDVADEATLRGSLTTAYRNIEMKQGRPKSRAARLRGAKSLPASRNRWKCR
jgi:hypothetical protein